MNRGFRCILLFLVAQGWFTAECSAIQILHTVILLEARFGLVDQNQQTVTSSGTIPLETGTSYGVDMTFQKQTEDIILRVELELPKAPKTWGGFRKRDGTKISDDDRTCTLTVNANTDGTDTLISWDVADGDPEGVYKVRVYLG